MTKPECAKCAELPAGERPSPPRPVVYGQTKPSRRCATHRRADVRATRTRRHDSYVQKTYGLSEGDYARLLELQGGKCAFPRCRATGKARRLAVDHDHATGEVRGLLCYGHNFELVGKYVGDLHDALAYLADPPARRLT